MAIACVYLCYQCISLVALVNSAKSIYGITFPLHLKFDCLVATTVVLFQAIKMSIRI